MGACVILALFLPKKAGSWRMFIDHRAISNITVKYRHRISRLDDMLDELWFVYFFLQLILRVDIIKLEREKVMNGKLYLKQNMAYISG